MNGDLKGAFAGNAGLNNLCWNYNDGVLLKGSKGALGLMLE